MRNGTITPNGVKLEKHEYDTVLFFTNIGKNIELIQPSNTPHSHNADFFMDGVVWEMKSPKKADRRTIERCFYAASNQSESIIIDLRRTKGKHDSNMTLQKCFKKTRKIRKMYIIKKDGKLEFYEK